MKKKLFASVCTIAVIVTIFFAVNYITLHKSAPLKKMLLNYINTNNIALLSLASSSPDQYIKRENIAIEDLPCAPGFDLYAIDTRSQDTIYYYSWSYSEIDTTKYIEYIPNESLSYRDLVLKTPQNANQTIRIDGLGINGEGYIEYHRITDNWYFFETFLPT